MDVQPGKTYLFKAFTTSDTDFTLLARRHHADGSTVLEQLRNPLERPGNTPFHGERRVRQRGDDHRGGVRLPARIERAPITVEGAYLEAADDVRLPARRAAGPQPHPEPRAHAAPSRADPDSWSPYASGASTVESGRSQDEDGSFLWTRDRELPGRRGKVAVPAGPGDR